jgi:hypothetical protein
MMKRRMAGDDDVLRLLRSDLSGGLDDSVANEDLGLSDEDLYRGQWGVVSADEKEELQEHLEGSVYPYQPLYPAEQDAVQMAYEADVIKRLTTLMMQYPGESPNRLLALALQ